MDTGLLNVGGRIFKADSFENENGSGRMRRD